MAVQTTRDVLVGCSCSGSGGAGFFQACRVGSAQMMELFKYPLTLGFMFGMFVFSVPAYFLLDRSPAVETVIHMAPDKVVPGQHFEAVWSVKVLRPHCRGMVHRVIIDSQRQVFAFASVAAVIHGDVGTVDIYRSDWIVPMGMSSGPAIFRRNTERWCNPLQKWLWPMQEVHEAEFTVE
jgi:hypothetical protein